MGNFAESGVVSDVAATHGSCAQTNEESLWEKKWMQCNSNAFKPT